MKSELLPRPKFRTTIEGKAPGLTPSQVKNIRAYHRRREGPAVERYFTRIDKASLREFI